jgi:hypothetical protein
MSQTNDVGLKAVRPVSTGEVPEPVGPRHKPLSQVETYRQIVGNLASHLRVWSSTEESFVRNALIVAESLIYKQLRAELIALDPGKESQREDRERHCDSVSELRRSHISMRRKIKHSRLYTPIAS